MQLFFKTLGVLITAFVIANSSVGAEEKPLPQGWLKSKDQSKNALVFKKRDDRTGSQVKIYPTVLLEQLGADEWLNQKLTSTNAPKGTWLDDLLVIRLTANIAYGKRTFTLPNGQKGSLEAMAYTADMLYVRLGVFINLQRQLNNATAKEATGMLASKISQLEKDDAVKQGRGLDIEKSPPNVPGIKQGRTGIKPGRYVGAGVDSDGKTRSRQEIVLYENGEYEFLNSRRQKKGKYVYSQATGRLNIEDFCFNSTYDPLSDYCVYGIDEKINQTILVAKDRRLTYRLIWSNPPKGLAPSQRKKLEELQAQADKRYKYTTAPGSGIGPTDIEAVLYAAELQTIIGGIELVADAYVLMKDGRVIDDIPVAPFMLDVARSRSRDSDRWGWWKQQDGQYAFAWNVDKKSYVVPSGNPSVASPFASGVKLAGTWHAGKSFDVIGVGSTSFWGVTFSEDGRFQKFRNTLTSAGGESMGGPLVTAYANDEGSTTVISGANVGGGSHKSSDNPKSEREGWYEFEGYNLTLKYDSGRIDRFLTFTTGDNYEQIWFEGDSMQRK